MRHGYKIRLILSRDQVLKTVIVTKINTDISTVMAMANVRTKGVVAMVKDVVEIMAKVRAKEPEMAIDQDVTKTIVKVRTKGVVAMAQNVVETMAKDRVKEPEVAIAQDVMKTMVKVGASALVGALFRDATEGMAQIEDIIQKLGRKVITAMIEICREEIIPVKEVTNNSRINLLYFRYKAS